LLFGVTSFKAIDATAYIKGKSSNEYITEEYKQDDPINHTHKCFNINTGINIFYFIYRGIGLNMEFNYYECKVNSKELSYKVTTTNSLTLSKNVSNLNYNQVLRQFSIGFGISYYFKMGRIRDKS
jgi:hypothetical protein